MHISLVNLGDRGEERKGGGGERALSSYTSWHSPEPQKASRRFIRLLWKDNVAAQDFRVGGEGCP